MMASSTFRCSQSPAIIAIVASHPAQALRRVRIRGRRHPWPGLGFDVALSDDDIPMAGPFARPDQDELPTFRGRPRPLPVADELTCAVDDAPILQFRQAIDEPWPQRPAEAFSDGLDLRLAARMATFSMALHRPHAAGDAFIKGRPCRTSAGDEKSHFQDHLAVGAHISEQARSSPDGGGRRAPQPPHRRQHNWQRGRR